ncbi:hypothetical protein M1D46_00530 [Microbacterium sp. JZ70]
MSSKTTHSTDDATTDAPVNPFITKRRQSSIAIAQARHRGDRKAEHLARQNHAATIIEDAIDKALASAPPLSEGQLKRLSALMRGGAK